jgi:predicted phosphodiesterase
VKRSRVCAVVLLLGGVGCQAPPAGWLYTTRVGPTSAVVAWSGRGGELDCRGAAGAVVPAEITLRPRGVSTARLTGLEPATRYRCRVTALDTRPQIVRFRTAPASATRFRFAVVGDSGFLTPETFALARRIRAGQPDFLIHLGDFAYPDGTARQLDRRFFRPYRRVLRSVPLYTTPGNHDLGSRSAYELAFPTLHDEPRSGRSYAFAWAGAHFVGVSSPEIEGAQATTTAWLERQLSAIPRDAWRIVFLHEPPYGPGRKRITPGIRSALAPILQAAHVDLLLAGHEHLYARSEPICDIVPDARLVQVISGGGGINLDEASERRRVNFPVVESKTHYVRVTVSPDAVDVRAIGLDGRTLDWFRRPRAVGPCRADGWPPALER